MKTGNSKQGLVAALEEMDNITQVDSAYLPGQTVCVTGTKINGKFQKWRPKGRWAKNKSFESPCEALEYLTTTRQITITGKKTDEIVWDMKTENGTYNSKSFGSIDEALNHLNQLDPNEEFRLSLTSKRKVSDDFSWVIKESPSSLRNGKPLASGKGIGLLTATLNELDHKEEVSNSISVLCMSRTQDHKTWNGRYKTTWIRVDPEFPFSVDEKGTPVFQTMDLELKENEYKVCLSTQLALYDYQKKDLYPIRSEILTNLARSLSSGNIFTENTMNGVPLAQAIIVANCLLSMERIKLVYRDRTEHVKPLIGLAGKSFTLYPQTEFFSEALECCREHGDCFLENWLVTDAYTSVDVGLTQVTPSYRPYIRIYSSDLPNTPLSITAYAKIGKAKIFIASNSARHYDSLLQKGSASLFTNANGETLFDDIEKFSMKFRKLESKPIFLNEDWQKNWLADKGLLFPLMNNMSAKKRNTAVTKLQNSSIKAGWHNSAELFCTIVGLIYSSLPPLQANKQEVLFADLLDGILAACDD